MNAMLAAALLAGILDILNAIVFWRLYSGTSATTILQSIAAGILGKPRSRAAPAAPRSGSGCTLRSCARWRPSTGSPASAGGG